MDKKKLVAGNGTPATGETPVPLRQVKVNPDIIRGAHQRLVFLAVRDDGGDLVIESGAGAEISESEWKRVKAEKDAGGAALVMEA